MVNSYSLVNPHIEGTIKTTVKATNSHEAASLLYKSLSEHFNNAIPKFLFSIQKGKSGNGKVSHFSVSEKTNDNQEVDYTIKSFQIKGHDNIMEGFQKKLNTHKTKIQDGGKKKKHRKHHDSDSSDSDSSDVSSDSDYYKRSKKHFYNQPLYNYWYDPYIYASYTDYVYFPTFYNYTTPLIFTPITTNTRTTQTTVSM